MEFKHKSVLLYETVDELNIKPDGIYVDGTLGGGGHSYEIAGRLSEGGRLIGIDQDEDAIKAASKRLEPYMDRVTIVRNNYCNMDKVLDELGIDKVDGIMLDLGVSSYQLDAADRGFTYNVDTALDMRMDQRQEITAKDIVNEYSEFDLYRIIRDYGEDRFAYKCTDFYHPGDEGGVLWSDPEIGIDWPIPEGVEPILSEKDKKWLGLKDTFHFE